MSDSVNKIIVTALRPFGIPVAERLYMGKGNEYFVYVLADDNVGDSGDDTAQAYVSYMQIHYICPLNKSYTDMKRQIRRALLGAGFTPPDVTDVSDTERHLVFECSIENEYELED